MDTFDLKKYLAENILKENGSINVLGLVNKPTTKDLKHNKPNK